MKAKFVIGMVLAATAITSVGHALPQAAVKKQLIEHETKARESAYGKGFTSATGLKGQAYAAAQVRTIESLKLSSSQEMALTKFINNSANKAESLDRITTITAAKEAANTLASVDPVEAKSLENSAKATTFLLATQAEVGSRATSQDLNAQQMATVSGALKKAGTLTDSIIKDFSTKERDSWSEIMNEADAILASGKKQTVEDAAVEAVITKKKLVDDKDGSAKDKAIALFEKLLKCLPGKA